MTEPMTVTKAQIVANAVRVLDEALWFRGGVSADSTMDNCVQHVLTALAESQARVAEMMSADSADTLRLQWLLTRMSVYTQQQLGIEPVRGRPVSRLELDAAKAKDVP